MACFKAIVHLVFCVSLMVGSVTAQLTSTFYNTKCADASNIVRGVVISELCKVTIERVPKLIRLHFHDCFVDGCDGSVLLEDQTGIVSELSAPANGGMSTGLNIVDDIKTTVENACPGVVSCADILALASRDSVTLAPSI